MNELEDNIEPKRQIVLLKMILFNNHYAEYLLTIERFKDKINSPRERKPLSEIAFLEEIGNGLI